MTEADGGGAVRDRRGFAVSGYVALGAILLLVAAGVLLFLASAATGHPGRVVPAGLLVALGLFLLRGLYVLAPNESAVLLLFGAYRATDGVAGLRFTNPLYTRNKVSRRLRTHEIAALKVNDAVGNPIEIGAAVVWWVSDSAAALLEIDDYEAFVRVQSDTALRRIAGAHAYDATEVAIVSGVGGTEAEAAVAARAPVTLLDGGDEVMQGLVRELQERVGRAGIRIGEARITHLAYAPEIAGAMLRRQQAEAVLAARRKIVAGAVDMVEDALSALERKGLALDNERRAAMVSNLLLVLVGDKDPVPVINAGTLNH
ncbi:MAG: hypothetical protein DI532_07115 [Azospirillum brasilense]|nr:MAG: hypothetical protein DI532_07115 [Azospirillum brasilense]